jgi:hypothetical protein
VCSLDAIAAEAVADAAVDGPLVVVTDARRREVYWAAYDAAGDRTSGPHVEAPAALAGRLPAMAATAAAGASTGGLGLPVVSAGRRPAGAGRVRRRRAAGRRRPARSSRCTCAARTPCARPRKPVTTGDGAR